MGLILNTDTGRTVEIDNTNEVFEGTKYADGDFSITLQPLTATQRKELVKKFENDPVGFLRALWQRMVKGWTGIAFEEGKDEPCTKEAKDAVFESNISFVELVLKAGRVEIEKTAVQADSLGNS